MNEVSNLELLLTPLSQIPGKIAERSYYRGWNLTDKHVSDFKRGLENLSDHKPLVAGADIWIGHDMQYNAFEAIEWLGYETNKVGMKFKFESSLIGRLASLNHHSNRIRRLGIVKFDFLELGKPNCGASLPELNCFVLWFLATNPKISLLTQDQKFKSGLNVVISDPSDLSCNAASIWLRYVEGTVYINDLPIQ